LKIIKPVDVEDFFTKNKALSKSILSKLHMCLNGIFETAIDNDLCYKNPAKRATYLSTKDKHEKKVYTDEQIEKVIELCIVQMSEVAILLETGLRRSELLGLMWSDFDEKNKTISVKRAIADIPGGIKTNPPKWNSYREIPLTDRSYKILKSITRSGLYVFPMADGTPHKPNQWSKQLKRFMDKTIAPQDVPSLTAHELRHTFGTALRRRGVYIYTIQKIMGHKDINMTSEIYVHNEVEVLKKSLGFSD
jgi:integrase